MQCFQNFKFDALNKDTQRILNYKNQKFATTSEQKKKSFDRATVSK